MRFTQPALNRYAGVWLHTTVVTLSLPHRLAPDTWGFQVFWGVFCLLYHLRTAASCPNKVQGAPHPLHDTCTDWARWPNTGGISDGWGDGREEQREGKTLTWFCGVAQRSMACYDVWRLKKGQNSIKPYEYETTVHEPFRLFITLQYPGLVLRKKRWKWGKRNKKNI